jgi:hypothetical protein
MSAPDDEVDGVRSCFHAGREPTSWFCIRRSTPRQPESWDNKASRASWAGIWAPALRTRPGMIHALRYAFGPDQGTQHPNSRRRPQRRS